MSKWITNGRHIHDNKTGWCVTFASETNAERTKTRHNAVCDEYEAKLLRIRELANSITAYQSPECIAELVEEIKELTK